MNMKINIDKFRQVVTYCLLFLAAMNFFAKFFYFAFASLILILIIQRKLLVNYTCLIYLALGVIMAVYNFDEGVMSMLKCLAYVALYLVGYNFMIVKSGRHSVLFEYSQNDVEKSGYLLLVMISAGSFTHYALNFIFNFDKVLTRNTFDIWSGEVMAATGQSTLACLMVGLAVAMIFIPPKKICRVIAIICLVIILAYNLILAGRTLIFITAILILLSIIYMHFALKTPLAKFKLLIGIAVAVLAVVFVFTFNIGDIRDYVFESNLLERFNVFNSEIFDTDRSNVKLSFIMNFWKYPFGGLHMRDEFGYAHDLLLDGYDEYGIFSLILLIAILITGIVELYKLVRYTDYSFTFKLALICIYVSILLEFCVEPILAGMPWLFSCYCLINGCITAMNLSYSRRKMEIQAEL